MTVRQALRIIRQLLAIDLTMATIYRGEFLIYMLSVIVTPLLGLFVWRTALAAGTDLPRDIGYFTTYYLMLAVVNWLTSSWITLHLAATIRNGDVLRWLIRPGSTHFNGLANNISEKLVKGSFLLPLIIVAGIAFRDSVELPADPARWLLFALSVGAAAAMMFALDVLIGSFSFWLDDVAAIDRGRGLLGAVLGGQLVPLVLMPDWMDGLLVVQPFRSMFSFPLEIITGDLVGRELALGFVLQAAWLTVIVWAAATVWKKGLRGYAAFGS